MKFVDHARIKVIAGKGGRGCLSFRREAFVPKGGPDGGNGGKGGDVVIVADLTLFTLLDCQYRQLYRARHGGHGMGKDRHGRSAPDLMVRVPVGTVVIDDSLNELIADLDEPDSSVVVAVGGRGGKGNAHFTTARNRAPRRYEDGEAGQERTIRLDLKLIADVGLVGMPNSGKSSLLAALTNARPIIADYPFSTKLPVLGVARCKNDFHFVIADIPGLLQDAHRGTGMGHRFLRHIERTKVLLHLIDPSSELRPEPQERFSIIIRELEAYDKSLRDVPMIAVITKLDLPGNCLSSSKLMTWFEKRDVPAVEISVVSGQGLEELRTRIVNLLRSMGTTK